MEEVCLVFGHGKVADGGLVTSFCIFGMLNAALVKKALREEEEERAAEEHRLRVARSVSSGRFFERVYGRSSAEMLSNARERTRQGSLQREALQRLLEEAAERQAPVGPGEGGHGLQPLFADVAEAEAAVSAAIRGSSRQGIAPALRRAAQRAVGAAGGYEYGAAMGGSPLLGASAASGSARAARRKLREGEEARWALLVSHAARRRLGREGRLAELQEALLRLGGGEEGNSMDVRALASRVSARSASVPKGKVRIGTFGGAVEDARAEKGAADSTRVIRATWDMSRASLEGLDAHPAAKAARFARIPGASAPAFRPTRESKAVTLPGPPRVGGMGAEPRTAMKGGGALDSERLRRLRIEWVAGMRPVPVGANLGEEPARERGGEALVGGGRREGGGKKEGGVGEGRVEEGGRVKHGKPFRCTPHCDALSIDREWRAWVGRVVEREGQVGVRVGNGKTADGKPILVGTADTSTTEAQKRKHRMLGRLKEAEEKKREKKKGRERSSTASRGTEKRGNILSTTARVIPAGAVTASPELVETAPWRQQCNLDERVAEAMKAMQAMHEEGGGGVEERKEGVEGDVEREVHERKSGSDRGEKIRRRKMRRKEVGTGVVSKGSGRGKKTSGVDVAREARRPFRTAFPGQKSDLASALFPPAPPVYMGAKREVVTHLRKALRDRGGDDTMSYDHIKRIERRAAERARREKVK